MRPYMLLIILGLVFFSCEKDECNEDSIINTLINGNSPFSYERIIGSDCSANSLTSVILISNSANIFCGTTTTNAIDGFDILILKTDNSGETMWFNSSSYIKYEYGKKIIKTKDDGFIILAASQPCFGWGGEYNCSMDLILLKFSDDASIEWEKTFCLDIYSQYTDIYQTVDGGYLIFYDQEITNPDGSRYRQSFYIITNENGQKISEEIAPIRLIKDGAKTQDESFIICGSGDNGLNIGKLNPQAESMWTKAISESSQYSDIAITEISNGYAICGAHHKEAYVEVAFIITLDSEGNELWRSDYMDNYNHQVIHHNAENSIHRSFENILFSNDENFVLTGKNADGELYTTAYLMKIEATTGGVIWQKSFNPGDHTLIYEIQNTEDNGYLMVGETLTYTQGTFGETKGYIVKTDENGDL